MYPLLVARTLSFLVILLLLTAPGLSAQLLLGESTANFGSVTLSPGFTPDPHRVSIISGGGVDVSAMDLGPGCVGSATEQPDYTVELTARSSRLRFFVEGDGDTGLIVATPMKTFECSDDAVGLDPMVTFEDAPAGRYGVWVSSYSSGENISSTLYVTELDHEPGDMERASTDLLEIGGSNSIFGSTTLSVGFMPDPYTVSVVSGGSHDVSAMDLGTGCVGWATASPDFILEYEQAGSFLRFYMEGDGDTALIVNAPDGSWHCNDDAFGTDPMVDFSDPVSGQYDVWIASYSEGANVSGTLSITELPMNRPGG